MLKKDMRTLPEAQFYTMEVVSDKDRIVAIEKFPLALCHSIASTQNPQYSGTT